MTISQIASRERQLRKVTSKLFTEHVLSQNASAEEIKSGIYQPVSKNISLLNFDRLIARRKERLALLSLQSTDR